MNGWTPSISQEVRVSNLIAQIPAEHRAPATKICYGKDDHEFERNLTSYVLGRVWEHPADVAFDLEAVTEADQVAAEVASDNQWLDSATVSESWQAGAIADAEFDADTKWTQECAL